MSHLSKPKDSVLSTIGWPLAVCFSFYVLLSTVHAGQATERVDEAPIFSKCWEYNVALDLTVNAVADQTNVYFIDSEKRLHGVDLTVGTKVWSTELGGEVVSNLLIADDSILVVTSSGSASDVEPKAILSSISRQTGVTEWRADIARSPSSWLGGVAGNVIAVGSDGVVSALEASKGALVWRTEIGSNVVSEPHFDDSGGTFGVARNDVVRIGGRDGRVEVIWKSKHLPTAIVVDSRDRLLIGDERGNLSYISVGGRQLWRFKNGARISRVLSYGSEYLAASNDNFIYHISRGGDVRWKRRLPARVAGTPLVLGNTVVVSIVGTGAVYVLDPRNGKISNRIESGDETSAGVTGRPDGQGFVMTSVRRVSYFGRAKCPAK